MTTTDTQPREFTPNERAYIRSELDQVFSHFPPVADGIQLRIVRLVFAVARQMTESIRIPGVCHAAAA